MGMLEAPRFHAQHDGQVAVTLPIDEYEVLYDLVSGLHSALYRTNPVEALDPMVDRLFPAIFEDPFEALTYDKYNAEFIALRHLKLNRFARVKQELAHTDRLVGQLWRTRISLEESEVWMFVLQDLRLSISRVAGIEKEDDVDHLDEEMYSLLHWLAYMLDELVHIFLESDYNP